jgi:hypothetical protein
MPPFFAFQLRVFALVLALLLPARVLFFALLLRAFAMVLVLWLPARVPLFAFQLRAFALALVLCLTFGPTEKVPDRYFRGLSWAPVFLNVPAVSRRVPAVSRNVFLILWRLFDFGRIIWAFAILSPKHQISSFRFPERVSWVQVLLGILLHQGAHVALVQSNTLIQVIYLGCTGLLHAGAHCRYISYTCTQRR